MEIWGETLLWHLKKIVLTAYACMRPCTVNDDMYSAAMGAIPTMWCCANMAHRVADLVDKSVGRRSWTVQHWCLQSIEDAQSTATAPCCFTMGRNESGSECAYTSHSFNLQRVVGVSCILAHLCYHGGAVIWGKISQVCGRIWKQTQQLSCAQ